MRIFVPVDNLKALAVITAQLVREGVTFNVRTGTDGFGGACWTIEFLGGF